MMYRVISFALACLFFPAVAAAEDGEPLAAAEEPAAIAAASVKDELKDAGKRDIPKPRSAPAAAAPKPVNGRIVHQTDTGRICIGGVLCPTYCASQGRSCKPAGSLTIRLDGPVHINAIQLSAHDNVGKTRRSRLIIKVNGKKIADTLVYRLGSTLTIDVDETGELITIESEHQYNGFLRGGEEAVVWDVYVFGNDGQIAGRGSEPDA